MSMNYLKHEEWGDGSFCGPKIHNLSWGTVNYEKSLKFSGWTNRSAQIPIFTVGDYCIIRAGSYSYRSGQGYCARMTYVGVSYLVVKILSGNIEDKCTVEVLGTYRFGKKYNAGLKWLQHALICMDAEEVLAKIPHIEPNLLI